jgi:hypothetical protein
LVQSTVVATAAPEWLDDLTLPSEPPWLPMGTRALRGAPLLEAAVGRGGDEVRWRKEQLLASAHDEVSVALSGAEAAAEEAAQLVARAAGRLLGEARPPLEAAALLVPDDLVVLVRREGAWLMGAGVVCFPSHWSPPAKLGLPIGAIHAPVPRYADELSERVDRFLDHLSPERPVWRRNWLVHASAELHVPHPLEVSGPVAPEQHWLRSERQVLTALPASGGILFLIRTEQVPFAVLKDRPDVAARLAAAMRSSPADLARYRFAGLDVAALVDWLERQSVGPAPAG